jgi:hypothetical protein
MHAKARTVTAYAMQAIRDKLTITSSSLPIQDDMPEITDWSWGARRRLSR